MARRKRREYSVGGAAGVVVSVAAGHRPYDLRHTYATMSIAAGVSLFMLARRMGYAPVPSALKAGNAHLALAAATELRRVDLTDALSLVLLIRD